MRAASRAMLVAAVRRARHPGCRFDQLPIIVGPQGSCKSSALRLLAVDPAWFGDDLPIGDDTRRLMEATAGKWIVEAGELEDLLAREADDEEDREHAPRRRPAALKAILSRPVDEARMAYQTEHTRVPRPFVIVGTTSATALLEDTGSRRFWPICIEKFDLDRLAKIRDQLWAEAAVGEISGEAICLDPTAASA